MRLCNETLMRPRSYMKLEKLETSLRLADYFKNITHLFSMTSIESHVSCPLGSETLRLVVKKVAQKVRPFHETYLRQRGNYV